MAKGPRIHYRIEVNISTKSNNIVVSKQRSSACNGM
jgi:hypothetical protein